MIDTTENESWILRGPQLKVFLQYQKIIGIHPERIEETKALMRKPWDVTQNIGQ